MDTGKIEKLLQHCDLTELDTIQKIVNGLIKQMQSKSPDSTDEEGRKLRKEKRFTTNILATLTRLTDVRPGERKEFSVIIQDISRNGMRIRVDTSFTPSRLMQITFAGPGGKIKQSFMEMARMRKIASEDETWLEVGCRSVNDDQVRRIRVYEEQVAKMRSRLHHKISITILVVGPRTEETEKLVVRIKSEGYQARREDSVHIAMKIAKRLSAQLAIICAGNELLSDSEMLKAVMSGPARLAKLALVDNEEDRLTLCKTGIDECLTHGNCETFLFQAIERALVGHLVRQNRLAQSLTGRALVVSLDNSKINLINYQLEEQGYKSRVVGSANEAIELGKDDFDLVLADFDRYSIDEFKQLRQHFNNLAVIALCDEISQGQHAMATGAANYLCMPPNKEDMEMILESCEVQMSASSD